MKRIELTSWEVCGYYPYVPQLGMEEPRLGASITDWMPATVPGSVHQDLWRNGWIDDPYFGMNSLRCEWVENKWWAYRSFFRVERISGRRYHLRMKGLDYKCRIYFNGRFLLLHEGSFTPVDLDVTDHLTGGEEALLIVFESVPDEESQAGHTSHTRTQKSRFSYKWDFSTRMVPIGIWDDIWLEETGAGVIDHVWLIPEVCGGGGRVTVRAACSFAACCPGDYYDVHMTIKKGGACLWSGQERCLRGWHTSQANLTAVLNQVDLWYPAGCGDQPLYDVELQLIIDGACSHTWTGRIGFKEMRWVANEDAPVDALPYCMQVNGRKVYMKGMNLTPFDMLIGTVSDERYESFLRLIRAGEINLVRVNGVGLIEKERFYELCDEYGILVWQEFIQTSSSMDRVPPTHASYMRLLGETSLSAIRIKRNHVSLACWGGGNELRGENGEAATHADPTIRFLQELIDAHDTGRMLLPTSGTGPSQFLEFGRQGISHDVHGPWNFVPAEHYALFNQSDCLLHGELGAEGMAHMDSLARFLAPEDLRVTDMKENRVWRHHGDWWDCRRLDTALFGEIPDLPSFVSMSQMMQAEVLRYALESNRRRKFHNSGSVMWAFNEPYPNVANTCLADYYGVPKMAYYAARDAFHPWHLSLRYEKQSFLKGEIFEAQLYLHNSREAAPLVWKAELFSLDGRTLHTWQGETAAPANASAHVKDLSLSIPADFPEVLLMRLSWADPVKGETLLNEYFFSTCEKAPFHGMLTKPDCHLVWQEQPGCGEEHVYTVRNEGRGAALCAAPEIPGENEFLFSEQAFKCLLPGEERVYRVRGFKAGKHWENCRFTAMLK